MKELRRRRVSKTLTCSRILLRYPRIVAEDVKPFETLSQPDLMSASGVGSLIHATVGSFGGTGRRWRNLAGLAA